MSTSIHLQFPSIHNHAKYPKWLPLSTGFQVRFSKWPHHAQFCLVPRIASASASSLYDDYDFSRTDPFRIVVSSGDVMGDIHAASVVSSLFRIDTKKKVVVYGIGGNYMAKAGAHMIGLTNGLSSIGLIEALPFVFPALQVMAEAESFLEEHPPDALILIDYPGFNIPFGQRIKKKFGCPITYYIPPNEWLWSSARTKDIIRMSDTILALYEQEAEHYRKAGGNVSTVGHPLVDLVRRRPSKLQARSMLGIDLNSGSLVIALVPASRKQELKYVWPVLGEAARIVAEKCTSTGMDIQFVIPVVDDTFLVDFERDLKSLGIADRVCLWKGDSYVALSAADIAITKSGSVTLELALMQIPQVVVYKIGPLSAWIARNILGFKLPWISIVNLILERHAVPEFIQEKASAEKVASMVLSYVRDLDAAQKDFSVTLMNRLGPPGVADRVARKVLTVIISS